MAALFKTRGIVINYIKYGETSIITKILTEEFGVQSYIINGVRSKKPRLSISFFQPLSLLNMVVYKKKNANLNRISEIECVSSAFNIPTNIYKSSIALFVSEILNKTLKEEMEDRALFELVYNSIKWLNANDRDFENFHLIFLLKMSAYLGFAPHSGSEILSQVYQHNSEINNEEVLLLNDIIAKGFDSKIKINVYIRRKMLEDLIKYYRIHVDNLGTIRSMEVLREVME